MKQCIIVALAGLLFLPGLRAKGQMATTRLRPSPATAPAEKVDPAVMEVLQRLETARDKFPVVTADLDYHELLRELGDTEQRSGKVYYQSAAGDSPAKWRIHFRTLRQGDGPKIKNVEDYVFDGQWLTIRKERPKQMWRIQVVPPGEKIEALELGKGPFPVPFGQKAETVLRHFRVSTRPARKSDPEDCDYLKLITRPEHQRELNVVWLEMWVQRKTGLPVKIVAEDASGNRKTVEFKDVVTPKSLPRKTFDLPRPPAGWEYRVEPYKPAGSG